MGYGAVVTGFSDKRNFDCRHEITNRIIGSDLANPILGSYITGTVRATIAEILNNIHKLKLGDIALVSTNNPENNSAEMEINNIHDFDTASVTTDGFITNVEDLENKLINAGNKPIPSISEYFKLKENEKDFFFTNDAKTPEFFDKFKDKSKPQINNLFLNLYRKDRLELTDGKAPEALEIKTIAKGLAIARTRFATSIENLHQEDTLSSNQESFDNNTGFNTTMSRENIPIVALTGFQRRQLKHKE